MWAVLVLKQKDNCNKSMGSWNQVVRHSQYKYLMNTRFKDAHLFLFIWSNIDWIAFKPEMNINKQRGHIWQHKGNKFITGKLMIRDTKKCIRDNATENFQLVQSLIIFVTYKNNYRERNNGHWPATTRTINVDIISSFANRS